MIEKIWTKEEREEFKSDSLLVIGIAIFSIIVGLIATFLIYFILN